MSTDIWALAEIENGQLKTIGLQMASKAASLAQQLGGKGVAVLLGRGAEAAAAKLGAHGVSTVYAGESEVYDQYLTLPHVDALAELVKQHAPLALLYGSTQYGKDVAARLAARLQLGMEYNVSDIVVEGGALTLVVPAFGGQIQVKATFVKESGTNLIGARMNAFSAEHGEGAAQVVKVATPAVSSTAPKILQTVEEKGAVANLEEAQFIVSGGRGLGDPKNFALLEELAAALDGSVGASRAAVDAGWISYPHQVGQTGKTVKPQVYIACGISGSVQHKAGMGTSNLIIAINKDGDAPIFSFCDLGIVADTLQVVPQLTQEVKKRKGLT